MVNFHANSKARNKRGHPVIPTDITEPELVIIKDAISKVPRHPAEADDELDKRLDLLYEKPIEDWAILENQEIKDLSEAVNKKLQDDETAGVQVGDFDPVLMEWKDKLLEIWQDANPS